MAKAVIASGLPFSDRIDVDIVIAISIGAGEACQGCHARYVCRHRKHQTQPRAATVVLVVVYGPNLPVDMRFHCVPRHQAPLTEAILFLSFKRPDALGTRQLADDCARRVQGVSRAYPVLNVHLSRSEYVLTRLFPPPF